jgi:outer membrane protein TolC
MERIRAADERAAAAVANYLPSLVVSASVGYLWQKQDFSGAFGGGGGFSLPDVVKGPQYNAGATLTVPLFDGFQRKAQIDQQEAALQEAVATYGQTVQQAVAEVENAVAQEQQQTVHLEHLNEQLQAASDTLESARFRYREGLTDFLNVLTAIRTKQQTELNLLTARRQLLSYRIQLHRALGGTWTRDLDAPPHLETP